MDKPTPMQDCVGPVLQAVPIAQALLAAIREANPDVQVVDRRAYFRVLVPGRCTVTREAIERHAGRPFQFPTDLECIMSSFKGKLTMSEDEVTWEAQAGGTP